MRSFNLNQKKSFADLLINLSTAIITLGIFSPIFNRNIFDVNILINIVITVFISFTFVFLSNSLLK